MNIRIYRTMKGQFWYKAKRDQDGGTIRDRDSKKLTGTNSSGPENCGSGQSGSGASGNLAPASDRAHFRSSFPHSMSLSSTRRQQVTFECSNHRNWIRVDITICDPHVSFFPTIAYKL